MTEKPRQQLWYRALVIAGGGVMLLAVAVELLAVLGRWLAMPLPGSIELVQVAVTVSSMLALLVATLNGGHARVRLLFDRLTPSQARALSILNALCSAAFFLLLCAGSTWLLLDLWEAHEESEIWRVPYQPLRVLVAAGTLGVACVFLASLREERK